MIYSERSFLFPWKLQWKIRQVNLLLIGISVDLLILKAMSTIFIETSINALFLLILTEKLSG